MLANILRHILELLLQDKFYFSNWTHFCQFYWYTLRCQLNDCELCSKGSYLPNEAARSIMVRLSNFSALS